MNGRPAFHKASKNRADRRILGKMEVPTNNNNGPHGHCRRTPTKTRFSSSGFQRKSGIHVLLTGLRL
jgi:hypothetical protein